MHVWDRSKPAQQNLQSSTDMWTTTKRKWDSTWGLTLNQLTACLNKLPNSPEDRSYRSQGLYDVIFCKVQNTIKYYSENLTSSQGRRQSTSINHKMSWSLKYETKILKQVYPMRSWKIHLIKEMKYRISQQRTAAYENELNRNIRLEKCNFWN